MSYRPPHRRNVAPQPVTSQAASNSNASAQGSPGSSTSRQNGSEPRRQAQSNNRGQSSIRSDHNGIQSTGGMRPTQRLKDVKIDEMDMIQSISRSGGDGAEGDALKDYAMQLRFRGYIDERIDKHYARFGTVRHTSPAPGRTDEIESLSSIVLLFRKLREGVVSSGRIDEFAIEVFESSVRLAILARHHAQLISSLSSLVPGLYLAVDDRKGKNKATPLDHLMDEMEHLDLSAQKSRVEFASIRLLYQLVQSDSSTAFHDTLLEITSPRPTRLHPRSSNTPVAYSLPAVLPREQLQYALKSARALSPTSFNPLTYFALLHDPNASRYERIVLGCAEDKVRHRAWEVMRKAYISTELHWAGQVCGLKSGEEEWVKSKGASVVGTIVKLR